MIHHVEAQVLILLLIASLVGIGARRMRVPYTLALVVAGLVLGFVHLEALHGLELDKDLLLLLFLPALLFEAALHIHLREFRRELVPILVLAVPGGLLAVGATAGLLWLGVAATGLEPRFGWVEAAIFAAVISATDPVSVLALFKELGVPRRLYLLVEGESLLNDGVAVVVFVILTAAFGLGGGEALGSGGEIVAFGLRTFIWMVGMGVLVGLAVGGAVSALTRQIDDHLIKVTLTTLVAYGSFLLAEQIHASGVLSTVTAGIVMGSFGRRYGMSVSTRIAMEDFWEYMAFLANSFVFLLVGLQLEPGELLREAPTIVLAFLAVLAARALTVYLAVPLAGRYSTSIPLSWRHVLVWGGLRGSLSMVLALSLPVTMEGRGLLVNMVFGVVAASLFLQGLTVGPLLARMGISGRREDRGAYELARLRALAARDARTALDGLRSHLDPPAFTRLASWYDDRARQAEAEAASKAGESVVDEQLVEGLQSLLDVERETVRHAVAAGLVSADVGEEMGVELDHRSEALEHAHRGHDERRAALSGLLGGPNPEEPTKGPASG